MEGLVLDSFNAMVAAIAALAGRLDRFIKQLIVSDVSRCWSAQFRWMNPRELGRVDIIR